MGTLERYRPLLLEINSTSRYSTRFLEVDARRSAYGVEILRGKNFFFLSEIDFTSGCITEMFVCVYPPLPWDGGTA